MKNPLEYTLMEIDALLQADPDGEHYCFNRLVLYVHERQKYLHDYQVQKVREQIRQKDAMPKRKARSMDQELLDACEIVTSEHSA